jgi:hypothetical protein
MGAVAMRPQGSRASKGRAALWTLECAVATWRARLAVGLACRCFPSSCHIRCCFLSIGGCATTLTAAHTEADLQRTTPTQARQPRCSCTLVEVLSLTPWGRGLSQRSQLGFQRKRCPHLRSKELRAASRSESTIGATRVPKSSIAHGVDARSRHRCEATSSSTLVLFTNEDRGVADQGDSSGPAESLGN